MKKKSYEDDDGRTVADMSELERMPLFLPRFPKRKKGEGESELQMSRSERRATVLAALGAALAIAAVFAVAIAGIIALLILLWT
ncbi:MAG: hypothetical protein IKT72_01090 [Clostridia bacterium]|nr:hypothetical protein [Clostridia bacterium]